MAARIRYNYLTIRLSFLISGTTSPDSIYGSILITCRPGFSKELGRDDRALSDGKG